MNDAFEPDTVAFCCRYAVYNFIEDLDGLSISGFPKGVKIEQLSCSGRIDTLRLLETVESGADGVYVVGCEEDTCHNVAGSHRAKKRVNYVKNVLSQLGMEHERVEAFVMPRGDEAKFVKMAKEMVGRIRVLGPSPLRGM